MAFDIFTDNFTRADGAVGNNWYVPYQNPSAVIASNKLSIPTGGTNANRNHVLARSIYEAAAVQRVRVAFNSGASAGTQFASAWAKINTTLHKGIRALYVNSSGGVMLQKVTAMNGTPVSTFKGTVGALVLNNNTDYVLEITANGTTYTGKIFQSDGVTQVGGSASFTDGEADAADYTAAWPCGLSTQLACVFDDFVSSNQGTTYFQAAQAMTNNAHLHLVKDRTGGLRSFYSITKTGSPPSVSATLAGLMAGVTSPTKTDPGTGTSGTFDLVAGSTAVLDAVGTAIEVRLTDGVDNFVLRPTVSVHGNARGTDRANLMVGYTSTPQKAGQFGDLSTLVANLHAAPNAKDVTKINDGTFNQAVGGTGYDYWRPGSGVDDLFNTVVAYGGINQAWDIFGAPWISNDNLAFATMATQIDATIQRFLDNGFHLVFFPMQPRFDSDSELTSSTLESVNGTTIKVTGYTFSAADIGRWLGVRHTSPSRGMYRQITAVDTGANTCTIESAFTVFPAAAAMPCKIWSGTRAALIAANNAEWAKRATDSGQAEAKQNATYGTKVYWYSTINGVNPLVVLKDYLNWADEVHVDTDAQPAGHQAVAGLIRDVIAYHRLAAAPATFTISPDDATIDLGDTQTYTGSEPTNYSVWDWTGGYPGPMTAFVWDATAGGGSFLDNVYTPGSAGSKTIRGRLAYALSLADSTTLTVESTEEEGQGGVPSGLLSLGLNRFRPLGRKDTEGRSLV